uniref:Uncharacterized protein n=1 Tax=Helianthus annuus TaxID=4232 RepID=A0A251TI36_HELAN
MLRQKPSTMMSLEVRTRYNPPVGSAGNGLVLARMAVLITDCTARRVSFRPWDKRSFFSCPRVTD